jgi:hypothetical protein
VLPCAAGYDVLVCQDGTVSEDPVWIRARMIDSNFASPANYSTVLGALYYRPQDAGVPTSQPTLLLPELTADKVRGGRGGCVPPCCCPVEQLAVGKARWVASVCLNVSNSRCVCVVPSLS